MRSATPPLGVPDGSHMYRPARIGLIAAVACGMAATEIVGTANIAALAGSRAGTVTSSLANAYTFLDTMLDQHATGTTLRLPQSFTGGFLQQDGFTDSVTYDDALIIDAYLTRHGTADVTRAKLLGDALLY